MTGLELIRSARKTMALQVREDGSVIVRAPYRTSKAQIEAFVRAHEDWIKKTQEKVKRELGQRPVITDEERRDGIALAGRLIPQRVAYYAQRMGVTYGTIAIREQKTRWGSCSSAGNLNFNWKLVRMPQELLDYVVVHELAHRREMNHSAQFWAVVAAELPDYQMRRKRLKEYR